MMKVLFCCQYLRDNKYVQGGIVIWGDNIVKYANKHASNLYFRPVSFGRRTITSFENIGFLRIWYGIVDLLSPTFIAIKQMLLGGYDIIHISTGAQLGFIRDVILLIFAKLVKVQTITHFHFGRIPQLLTACNWESYLLKRVLKLSDKMIVMDMKSYNVLNKIYPDRVYYLPNPLTEETRDIITTLQKNIKRKPNTAVFVGHVIKTKGVVELVKGCSLNKNISLNLLGAYDEEMRRNLESIAHNNSYDNKMEFKGEVCHDDVIKELLSSEYFIFPSYTEGFPNVVLEAMACGCLIIASSVGAIPEMLGSDNSKCGIIINPMSSEEVDDAIKKAMALTDKQKLVENAIRRVSNLFSTEAVWKEMNRIWESGPHV